MIKIEDIHIDGWEAAIRGMRNPMNSWDKSDSVFYFEGHSHDINGNSAGSWYNVNSGNKNIDHVVIGKNDLDLMRRLSNAGSVHGKFLRMINVTMDITAPLYWWKEFDTYKVGTVANSCSTMHKITSKEFTFDDFSFEHLIGNRWSEADNYNNENSLPMNVLMHTIFALNENRYLYLKAKESGDEERAKLFWWQLIQLLPSSYNQKRTVQLNYQVLKEIYEYRKDHKLDEWKIFCEQITTLPYAKELILCEEARDD